MGSQTENLLTVIDVGSAKTCVIVAEVNDYALRYRGHGVADSRGMRKGVIADLDKASASFGEAVIEAENIAQAPVELERAAMALGLAASLGGLLLAAYLSFHATVAPGPTIVLLSLAGFALTWPVGAWLRHREVARG